MVVGDGPALARLKQRYPDVHFLGALSGEALAAAYAAADVFVFPSRTDTFGLVMIEALACGTPVAAYPVPGPIDVLDDEVGAMDTDLDAAIASALDSGPRAPAPALAALQLGSQRPPVPRRARAVRRAAANRRYRAKRPG